MVQNPSPLARVTVDGKFFRLGKEKFFVKGVTYGPFAPKPDTGTFASQTQTAQDFLQLKELGANTIRVYAVPPKWLLDLAMEHRLKVLVDIPWPRHLCFLDSNSGRQEALQAVREAVGDCHSHPAVMAFSVVNEIPADIVRWSGAIAVAEFIEELIAEAKKVDAGCLCTFASFPPTEFLQVKAVDFVCFNVYLHQARAFERYLDHLQILADSKPLMLGEFGMDSIREGEERKCEMLITQIQAASRAGLAGSIVYSFTDDWFCGGNQIEDWAFGLTTASREPKKAFWEVQKIFTATTCFTLPRSPRVSVVVASYNGGRTLEACLDSLERLNYPDYEVILVDDGSTDNTQEVVARHPKVRNLQQTNHGLSVARNVGIAAATGEIVAFTDSDCRADEDWLYYLINDLLRGEFVGIGGHNLLPPEDSWIAAAVMVSPGGPAHVMLTDREAEHIPGCNMAFYKWALDEIGRFDPVYRKAGDDVDVCWRLQERGYPIGFSSAGFVWHYRRSTAKAYRKQQQGYGEAEALLAGKHPERFNALGGVAWRGRIYAASKFGVTLQRNVIYRGIFGSGFFQKLYQQPPAHALMFCTSLEYHCAITLPLLVLALSWKVFIPIFLAAILLSIGICAAASLQADLPKSKTRFWSRPLVTWLFFIQPIVRGLARYQTQLHLSFRPLPNRSDAESAFKDDRDTVNQLFFWSRQGTDRYDFLECIISRMSEMNWQTELDSGWSNCDVEIIRNRWTNLKLATVNEILGERKIFLRCRIQAGWSTVAKIIFLGAVLSEWLIIEYFAAYQPWLWMILLTLPILAWFFDDERQYYQLLLMKVIEDSAARLKLEPYEAKSSVVKQAFDANAAGART